MDTDMTLNILQLPDDVLVNIFKKLNLSDLPNVIRTCKTLKNLLLNDNAIWRSVCKDKLVLNKTVDGYPDELSWYNRCRISNNWCSGIYRNKALMQFSINYMPWLQVYNSEFLLLSIESEVYCFTINSRGLIKCYNPLWRIDVPIVKRNDVRTNDVSRFVFKNGFLVCGNRDGSTAVYKVNNIREKPKLITHIPDALKKGFFEVSAVECMSNNSNCNVIMASNYYPYIAFWDSTKGGNVVQSVLEIPMKSGDGVRTLALEGDNNRLALGLDGNSTPLLLDVNAGQFLLKSTDTRYWNEAVRDVKWHDENTIAYVTHLGVLGIIDIRTHLVVYEVNDPFQSTLYCLKSDGNNAILVGSSEYSRCVLFDTRNNRRHIQLYFTHRRASPVYSLDFDSTRLISGIDRGVSTINFNVKAAATHKRDYSHVFC